MSRKPFLEVANFVCKFGKNDMHTLVDHVVLPAFRTERHRKTASGIYLLHEVELLALDGEDPAGFVVAGRLVKDMTLKREQVLTGGELIRDEKSMPSAPTSFFLLRLLDHRLCYVKELGFAPTISEFESTMAFFIRHEYERYVQELHLTSIKNGDRITKTLIRQNLGPFNLDIKHVGSDQSVREFVDQFATLKKLRLQLVATNAEVDLNPFFKQWRKMNEEANAKKATMESRNPEGLNKRAALRQLAAAKDGHLAATLTGEDEAGKQLTGTNEDFKVKVPLPDAGLGVRKMAATVSSALDDLVKDKVVAAGPVDDADARKKLASLKGSFKK